jgi:enamine deaminase RidA (YjgF/YER057c/UK114 family)
MAQRHPFRVHHSSGTPWEPVVGYARAVRAGDEIFVSGTTATGAGGSLVGVGDASTQARQALANLRRAIEALGGELSDVVRTRIYVKDIRDWEGVARAHHEFFRDIRPATTMVQVAGFIDGDMLVEIEADARVPPGRSQLPEGPSSATKTISPSPE